MGPRVRPCTMVRQWFATRDDDDWYPTYDDDDAPDDGDCEACGDAEWASVMWSIEYEEYFFYCEGCAEEKKGQFDDLVSVD